MVGVNGAGKTTTIGKLARRFQDQGLSVMLAAGDTFRAAAVEQLQVWGERNDVPVIAQQKRGRSGSRDIRCLGSGALTADRCLLADTAGRLQNQQGLMDELAKIKRVIARRDENRAARSDARARCEPGPECAWCRHRSFTMPSALPELR